MLRRDCGPPATQKTIAGRNSYWLRGRLTTPLLPDGPRGQRTAPVINDIRARVGFKQTGIAPEAAFVDGAPLDISKDFYPFGQQPATHTTFYLACQEVFQRRGATVELGVNLSQAATVPTGTTLELKWEYFDGTAWQDLGIRSSTTQEFYFTTSPATLSFNCPRDWAETSVNGVKNFWLRVRIISGDYGHPIRGNVNIVPERNITAAISADHKVLTVANNRGYAGGEFIVITKGPEKITATVATTQDVDKLVLTQAITGEDFATGWTVEAPVLIPANLQPPIVKKLTLAFTYLTDPVELDHCLSSNDFIFEDHTEDCRWPDRTFQPFRPVADLQPAVHFGFDRPLPVGLVSLYADIPGEPAEAPRGSPFVWEYRSPRGWTELGVLDETLGFHHSGMIQFIGPPDAVAAPGVGGERYRVRARLKSGVPPQPQSIAGIWLNAVWAEQHTTVEREELGRSDGNPGQTFSVRLKPVLEGETIEVQEWQGRGEGWRTVITDLPENELRFERDPLTDAATAVWAPWRCRPHLYHSGPTDRHYTLERANGLIRFGDGRRGLIPPADSRLIASYSSGGGVAGNVPAGAITELRAALPFIQAVTNPIPASGGADIEITAAATRRGPQRLRHHDRAVSFEDYEWLAREASPDVARVRCLPLTGPAGYAQRGWITLLIAPYSPDPQPQPSPELRRRVRQYLAGRVPAAVARQVRIEAPCYWPVSVQATIVPHEAGQAAEVEARLRNQLNRFLHPLHGGPDGQGWAFGQPVYLSQLARVIEETPGVDYAPQIRLRVNNQMFDEVVPVGPDTLIAAGDHELKLSIGVD